MKITTTLTAQQEIGVQYVVQKSILQLEQAHNAKQQELVEKERIPFSAPSINDFVSLQIDTMLTGWYDAYATDRIALPENQELLRQVAALPADKLEEIKALVTAALE